MIKRKIQPLTAHEAEARLLIQSVNRAARVLEDVLDGKVTPKTVDAVGDTRDLTLSPQLEGLLGQAAGAGGENLRAAPNGITDRLREVFSLALEKHGAREGAKNGR